MGLEDLNQPLIFSLVIFQALELETAGAKTTGWCGFQRSNVFIRLFGGVDELFSQCADNSISAGIDSTDFVVVLARGLNNATG